MKSLLTFVLLAVAMVGNSQNQERIITAGSAITETVCALGDCDRIVGSDRTSLYPAKIQQLPSIGYRSGINAEGILSLKPTMVIAEKDYVDQAVLQQLTNASIKLVIIDRKLNVEDTKKMIEKVGSTLNRKEEASKLIADIDSDLKEAQQLLSKKTNTPKVLCIYNRGTSTVSAAGTETFAEILKYSGAENAFADIDGYKPLNTEALIKANPDYLLMVSTGFESLGGLDGVLKIKGVAVTTAGKKKQVISMESLKLTNFGPRLGEAVKELVLQLHPELAAK
jgi:iron complex transport system substrate-binding protein